jgi:hypothetical protein
MSSVIEGALLKKQNKVWCQFKESLAIICKGKGNISKSSGRYWGHAGLFFRGRKALPHFIERRISLKIHLRTAP